MKSILRTGAFIVMMMVISGFDTPAKKVNSYGPGEFLEYSLNYGFIKGGKGYLTVNDTLINGVNVNHVVAKGETVGLPMPCLVCATVTKVSSIPQTICPLNQFEASKKGVINITTRWHTITTRCMLSANWKAHNQFRHVFRTFCRLFTMRVISSSTIV